MLVRDLLISIENYSFVKNYGSSISWFLRVEHLQLQRNVVRNRTIRLLPTWGVGYSGNQKTKDMKYKKLTKRLITLTDQVLELSEIVKKLYARLEHDPLTEEESNNALVYRELLNNASLGHMSFVLGPFNCHIRIHGLLGTWSWEIKEQQTLKEKGISSSCLSGVIQCLSYYQVYRNDTKPVDEPTEHGTKLWGEIMNS